MSLRRDGERTDEIRSDIAARRLAALAADIGAGPPPPRRGDDQVLDHTLAPWWDDHTRITAVAAAIPPLPEAEPPIAVSPTAVSPTAVRAPGRHAARRRAAPVTDRLGAVRDRLPVLSPAHIAVVALAVAVGLAVTAWWVVRDDPAPSAAGAPVIGETIAGEPLVPVGATASSAPSGAAAVSEEVTVDVAGKVRRPGIVVLARGARVTDALEAAGGPRRGVDLTSLNLARVLVDGEQILVGASGAAAAAGSPGAGAPTGVPGALVNLNLATQAELESLPQVGPVTAQSIISWRDQRGGFTSIDELLEVDGIGEKSLARLAPLVTV
ncbi:helix-hairpin-helix domain-containing protein [Nocardioides sp. Root190]|uniref:helix-hairpin-helix domain-containing protein n=1 Tax=Nocardioides sp. Root190 TaxID=1736488 RepID=UPI0009EB49C4|nr:helix-hairpin-helix domain-containing protein [Nocardioides sp. Root190]